MERIKFFLIINLIFLLGCSVPGTYLDSYHTVSSSNLKGRLLRTNIISLEDSALRFSIISESHLPYHYRIGSYDTLSITVWNHPELSAIASNQAQTSNMLALDTPATSQFSSSPQSNASANGIGVDSNGEIVFPLIGKVKIAGLTIEQARARLTASLAKYIHNPQVSLKVSSFNSQHVYVLGEVVQPGVKPLSDRPFTILDALSFCGGINSNTADARHIYILRIANVENIAVYWLNAKSPQALVLAEHFRMADNDIIYVSPAGVISWNRVVSQILPTVQTLWQTQSFIRNW